MAAFHSNLYMKLTVFKCVNLNLQILTVYTPAWNKMTKSRVVILLQSEKNELTSKKCFNSVLRCVQFLSFPQPPEMFICFSLEFF